MENHIAVQLVNGEKRKIRVEGDLTQAYKQLERGVEQFARQWLATEDGSAVRRDAIVEYWGETTA